MVDTNILISAAIKPISVAGAALKKALLQFNLYTSAAALEELENVLQRSKFDRYFIEANPARAEFVTLYRGLCTIVEPSEQVFDCVDASDNKFLEIAIAAQAVMLISGDKKHLLAMSPYRGVRIISAGDFLAL